MPFAGSETDAAWLAGIIDGEGSINSYMRAKITKRKGGIYGVFIQIVNTDKRIIDKVMKICQSNEPTLSIRPNRKLVYHIAIAKNSEVISILEKTLPYLTGIKQLRAVLAIEYLKSRGEWGDKKGHHINDDEIKIFEKIREVR